MELETTVGSVDAEYGIPVVKLALGYLVGDREVVAVIAGFGEDIFSAAACDAGLGRPRCGDVGDGARAAGSGCYWLGGAAGDADTVVDL